MAKFSIIDANLVTIVSANKITAINGTFLYYKIQYKDIYDTIYEANIYEAEDADNLTIVSALRSSIVDLVDLVEPSIVEGAAIPTLVGTVIGQALYTE